MFNNLKELCLLNGTSGNEKDVREYIINQIKDYAEYHVDALGNVTAFKKGKKTPENKIMIDAHMDEVALIVTSVQSDGTLTVEAVGGIEPSVVIGRHVTVGSQALPGVVGSLAVHRLSKNQREKTPEMSSLYVDFGAKDAEDAEKYVSPGNIVYFSSEYIEFGNDMIKSKAIDDRFGCALLIELIKSELEYDAYFTFTVQEEIGLRGAKTAAFAVNPDIAIAVEATTAADIEGVSGSKKVCSLGDGAVVSYMDRSTMYDKELYNCAFEIAKEKNIRCQTKSLIAGGNNSGAIHIAGNGVRTIAVSAPCRYLHSPSCVVNKNDLISCLEIVKELMKKAAVL
ncbi:M42 family metallopeptidase [Porcipelethomonas sp.]|uniref:M42 family metallopeptidase n=1 Tax=Porcipelethomonas sp. TaxID=2981675 RepID=UPI003EF8C36E